MRLRVHEAVELSNLSIIYQQKQMHEDEEDYHMTHI